jgi:hypothetical protein
MGFFAEDRRFRRMSMQYHRYQIGDTVTASAMGVPPGPYRISRLVAASDNGVMNYRARSLQNDEERALAESALSLWSEVKTYHSRLVC